MRKDSYSTEATKSDSITVEINKDDTTTTGYVLKIDSSYITDFGNDFELFQEIYDLDSLEFIRVDNLRLELSRNDTYFIKVNTIKPNSELSEELREYNDRYNLELESSINGDFVQLILENDSNSFEFTNLDGWVISPEKFHSDFPYFLLLDFGLKFHVLGVIGYKYSASFPKLTLIGFDDFGPKVIFSQEVEIISIGNKEILVRNRPNSYWRISGDSNRLVIE